MNKWLRPPSHSEIFAVAAVQAAIRSYNRNAKTTEFDHNIQRAMDELGADPAIVRRIERRLDSRGRRSRRALFPFADDWVPPRRPQAIPSAGMASSMRTLPSDAGAIDDSRELAPYQYRIRYKGLHCRDETGRFSNGSDEMYVITNAIEIRPDGQNEIRTEKHPIDRPYYGDIDSGETREGPIAACWQGSNLPITLNVIAMEQDHGDPDYYRDEIHNIVAIGLATAIAIFAGGKADEISKYLDEAVDLITDAINWLLDTDDDQIDKVRTRILTKSKLERVGATRASHLFFSAGSDWEEIPLKGHFYTPHAGDNGSYVAVFDVERIPPFVIREPVEPVVD